MAKIGIEIQVDVTKIDKSRLFKGAKGTYLTMTAFVECDPAAKDQYGNHGMVTMKKLEGEQKAPILGNVKTFWTDGAQAPAQQAPPQQAPPEQDFDESIPF